MQIVLILPTTTHSHLGAARECVRWLERRLPGFSIFDLRRENPPREPGDESVGPGVLRGFWKQRRKPPLRPIVHRDRNVMLVSDVEQQLVAAVEQHIQRFITRFFCEYKSAGEPQEAIYIAVQGARLAQCRRLDDVRPWRFALDDQISK